MAKKKIGMDFDNLTEEILYSKNMLDRELTEKEMDAINERIAEGFSVIIPMKGNTFKVFACMKHVPKEIVSTYINAVKVTQEE